VEEASQDMPAEGPVTFRSESVEQTQGIARDMARRAQAGDVILLVGDLGAGKTHFTQGFAAGLGEPEVPTSPTFNLVSEYHGGRLPLYHFDLYRLDDAEQLEDIDYFGIIEGDGVSLVEWGDKFEEAAPDDCLVLDFSVVDDGLRVITAKPTGPRGRALLGK
jgi:tRNA threonylcarbamoyladenosine biosynthesis protein TsaE